MPLKAVIFDMDGVLVDSEPAHQARVASFFAERGLDVPQDELSTLVGCSHEYFVDWITRQWELTPHKKAEEQTLEPFAAFWQATKDTVIDYTPLVNPGVRATLEGLQARGIRLAVASSTSYRGIRQELGPSDLLRYFEVIVSGEDFVHSKPHPAIYLTTMAHLGLTASECIAVEDSDRGIAAGRSAGLRVAVKREPRFGFSQEGGSWYVDRVDELPDIVSGL